MEMASGTSMTRDYFSNSGVEETLKILISMVKTCFGPNSRLKLLQNDIGGHMTMTSSSGRLLNLIYADEPVVKIIVNAVKKHVHLNIDGGLFCLVLTSALIHDSLSLDQHRMLIGKIYHDLYKILDDYYRSEMAEGVRNIDFSSIKDLMALCRCILIPKSGCSLDESELKHVCKILMEAFVRTFSPEAANSAGDMQIIGLLGASPDYTTFVEGILFEMELDSQMANLTLPANVKFVLVTTSLAGDYGDEDDVAYVNKENVIMDDVIDRGVYIRMTSLCDQWVADGVGLVLCQKVVHWSIVDYLRKSGVCVIQRLGLQTTQYLLKITGGAHVSSILQPASADVYGALKDVRTVEYCGRMYYQLNVLDSTTTSTLVVVNRTEESLLELQSVCRTVVDSLRMAARHPKFIRGEGYFENHGARYLRQQVRLRHLRMMQTHQCSRNQLYAITEQFCRSLEMTVSHFSEQPRSHTTNLVQDFVRLALDQQSVGESETDEIESEIVDLLCIKLAALHTAVFTACGLIQVDALYETQNF